MNKKSYSLIKISIFGVIAIALVLLLIVLLNGNFNNRFFLNFNDDYELVYSNEYDLNKFSKFNFDLNNADLDIIYNDSNNVKLEVYDKDKDNVSVDEVDEVLNVKFLKFKNLCFGFCFSSKKVRLFLPRDFVGFLNVSSVSGDVYVDDYQNFSGKINTTSGEINVRGMNELVAKSTSGDISVNYANNLEVISTSGELDLGDISKIKFETTSGDVDIVKTNFVYGKTTSGEVDVKSLNGSFDLSSTSGDIDLESALLDSNSSIYTVSGEVDVTLLKAVNVDVNTVSGDKDIYNTDRNSDISLKINTTSGDIEVN